MKNWLSLCLWGVLAALIIGCSATVDEEDAAGSSENNTVSIQSISINSSQDFYETQGGSRLATKILFGIKACLKDRILNESYAGMEYSIAGDGMNKEQASDSNGCLYWDEEIVFDYKNETPVYFFNKVITGKNPLNISLNAKYAINPWKGSLVDLTRHATVPAEFQNPLKDGEELKNLDLDQATIRFGGMVSANDSSSNEQKLKVVFQSCIKTLSEFGAIVGLKNRPVKVSVLDMESGEVESIIEGKTTTINACLSLSWDSHFDQFAGNRWYEKLLKVEILGGPYKGKVLEREFYINPVQRGRLFGWDSLNGNPPSNPQTDKEAKIHLERIKYTFIGNEENGYKINKYLDLSFVKSYLVELEPKVDLGHDFEGDNMFRPISSGRFKLRFMLLAPKAGDLEITNENIHKFQVLSGDEVEVEAINGRILGKVNLKLDFTSLPLAQTRTMAVVELSPMDDESPLQPALVSGQFFSSSHQFSIGLRDYNQLDSQSKLSEVRGSFQEYFKEVEGIKRDVAPTPSWKIKPFGLFHELHKNAPGLENIKISGYRNMDKVHGFKLNKNDFTSLMNGKASDKIKQKFCKSLFPTYIERGILWDSTKNHPMFWKCTLKPSDYISFRKLNHIESIDSQPVRTYSATDRINIGTGFFMYKSDSNRTSRSKRWSAGAGLSAKFEIPFISGVGVGGGVNYDVAYMKSKDLTIGNTTRGSFSRTRNIYSDMITLNFDAKVRECVFVEGLYYTDPKTKQEAKSSKRFHICDHQVLKKNMDESWYYIGESNPTMTLLRDRWSEKENKMVKVLRGQGNFEKFYNLMADDTKVVFLRKIDTIQSPDAYYKRFYSEKGRSGRVLLDGALPGIIEQ